MPNQYTTDGLRKRYRSEYRTWTSMKARCKHQLRYKDIKVCERWANDFAVFLADMGPKPSSAHSIDRYPNGKGDYEPGNCRWATKAEQQWSNKQRPLAWRQKTANTIYDGLRKGTNAKAKLTPDDVRAIREVEGEIPRKWLAEHYGINIWHVRDIQKRRIWAWVE